jgi:hypothetical protein
MAHYAEVDSSNLVVQVVVVDNIDCMTRGGIFQESIGRDFLNALEPDEEDKNWILCTKGLKHGTCNRDCSPCPETRANYPGIGWHYDSTNDIFYEPQPYDSWTLDTTLGKWNPPIPEPTLTDDDIVYGKFYRWNEDAHQADNTTGWDLILNEEPPE